jgi:phosphoribosylanthranilate isomerase
MGKVKICGLSRMVDVEAANHAMPDFVGFIFAEKSRRCISEQTAASLKERLDARIEAVGVFVNQDLDFVASLYAKGTIDLAQLHGDEDDSYTARLRGQTDGRRESPLRVIRAVGVGGALPPLPMDADFLLFDTASEQRGGIGKTFSWRLLEGYGGLPYFLAGGLNALNVADAIRHLSPFCVDASSGVETDGFKDSKKIHEFVRIARDTYNRS